MTFRRISRIPQLLGISGAVLLALGAAAPLIHIPIVGNISYLHHLGQFSGNEGAFVILITAGLSMVMALAKRFAALWLTGLVALAQVGATLFAFHERAATMIAQADQNGLSDPAVMWTSAVVERAHLDWGIAVLAGGAVAILAAAAWDYGQRVNLPR